MFFYFAIIFVMLFTGSNPLCGGYEPEPCSSHCCCNVEKMVCSELNIFPPPDLKLRPTTLTVELIKSCLPEIDVSLVNNILPSLQEMDFDGSCVNCLNVIGAKQFIIKGRALCPESTNISTSRTSTATITQTVTVQATTSISDTKTGTTASQSPSTNTTTTMSIKPHAKSTSASTIGLSVSLPLIALACVGVIGLMVWKRVRRTRAPIAPPPSVSDLNAVELSVLATRRTFADQGIQTDVPRIPTIPLPAIPRQAIENGAPESEGYESVRDSGDTIFEMPDEVHSWQARLFGYPRPDNSQYYNISFVNNALNNNAQRIRAGLWNHMSNPFIIAGHKESIRKYKTLASDMGSKIGNKNFNWDNVVPMSKARFQFCNIQERSGTRMVDEAVDHGLIEVTRMEELNGPMVGIKIILIGQFWSEGTFWSYTYEGAANQFWNSVLGELVMSADDDYRRKHTSIAVESSIGQYIEELDIAVECIAAQLTEPMVENHSKALARLYNIIRQCN